METNHQERIDETTAEAISVRASQVFQPRTPINRRDFFAGRWDQLTTIVDAVSQVGLHVVIHGERGVGKTSIANVIAPLLHVFDAPDDDSEPERPRLVIKVNANSEDDFSTLWARAFDEIAWPTDTPRIGFASDETTEVVTLRSRLGLTGTLTIDNVRRTLANLPGSVFIFDEFDRFRRGKAKPFTDLVKVLSDYAIESTVILVGVSETIDELIEDHASIARALIQVPMPRMKQEELQDILNKAQQALSVRFDNAASDRIVRMSQGLPHYTHLVGQNAVRCACEDLTRIVGPQHVNRAFIKAVQNAYQSVRTKYTNATHSAHPDALYRQVLLACAVAAYSARDDQGFFQAVQVVAPLSKVLGKSVAISTFNKHLTEFCVDDKRGHVLERRGEARSYRYRFHDPLVPPYVIMKGVSSNLVTEEQLTEMIE